MKTKCVAVGITAKRKRIVFNTVLYALMILIAVFLIFPYLFMLSRSFMSTKDVMELPVRFFPSKLSTTAWVEIFSKNNYFKNLLNTLLVAGLNTVTMPIAASLCAYGFTKLKYPGSGIIFSLVLATIMIPGVLTQIPLYVLFSKFGWTESVLPLVVPPLFGGGAMNIFLTMQFMRSIPKELENAARIDGAGVLRRYMSIIMPLCVPILLYMAVTTFTASWSDFYGPLVYLKNADRYTLAIAIYYDSINTNAASEAANIRMAAGVFMSIVPLLLFGFYQRRLVDGIMIGAVKG